MKLIMENWRKYNSDPFALLCEQYDKKIITEEQLLERWEQDLLREVQELSEQEPTKKRGVVSGFMEKVHDWILSKLVQLESLFERGKKLVVKAIAKLARGIKKVCSKRLICKLALGTLVVVGTFLVIAMINEAHAKIANPKTGKILPDNIIAVMKGDMAVLFDALMDAKESMDDKVLGMTTADLGEAMQKLDEMHKSVGTESFANASDKATKNVKKVWDHLIETLKDVKASAPGEVGEERGFKAIEVLYKIGNGAEAIVDRSDLGTEASIRLKGTGKVKALSDPRLDPFRAVVDGKPKGDGGIRFGGDIEYGKLRTQRN
jgi:hypothetical protein